MFRGSCVRAGSLRAVVIEEEGVGEEELDVGVEGVVRVVDGAVLRLAFRLGHDLGEGDGPRDGGMVHLATEYGATHPTNPYNKHAFYNNQLADNSY